MQNEMRAVGVIFEDLDGRILVLRRHTLSREGETWGLVGGEIDKGEDKISAAVRETKEEIGFDIQPTQLQFLKTFHWKEGDSNLKFETFKFQTRRNKLAVDLDKNEHTEFRWSLPQKLYSQKDLMRGLYTILEDVYGIEKETSMVVNLPLLG